MKRFKKASIILLVCMLLSVIAMPVSASAAKLNKKSVSLNVGITYTLKAKGTKGKITWTSNNKSVATVSSKGVVKAVGNGTATITVKVKDGSGKKATCKITVGTSSNTTPTYKTVEITLENWKNYIEEFEVSYYRKNSLGKFDGLYVYKYYAIKPEYMPYLDMQKSFVNMETAYTRAYYYATIDASKKKYTLSDSPAYTDYQIDNVIKFHKATYPLEENMNGYSQYLKNKCWFGDLILLCASSNEVGKTIMPYPINMTVNKVTGTLYFKQ